MGHTDFGAVARMRGPVQVLSARKDLHMRSHVMLVQMWTLAHFHFQFDDGGMMTTVADSSECFIEGFVVCTEEGFACTLIIIVVTC